MANGFLKYEASGVAGLLRTRVLSVPFYQRSYSWRTTDDATSPPGVDDKLQVVDFWTDLLGSFEARSSYFMGTVVLSRDGEEGRHSVIDGQQRLATTSLLLAAIRDKFRTESEARFADSIQQEYLGQFDRQVGVDRPKLILNTDDRDFYGRRVIDGDAATVATNYSQRLLYAGFTHLRERVDEFAAKGGTAWRDKLNELVTWLDSELQIVAIEVATEADAFLIFETLNDRGADLTIADLLKNYLFSKSGARIDEVRDSWVATLSNLDTGRVGNQRFTSFARHLLSSMYGRTREREVYSRLKNIVADPASAVAFAQELKDSSRAYYALLTTDSDFWADFPASTAGAAEVLVDLNLEQNRPLLLAVLAKFSKAEVRRFMPAMVSWAVRGLAGNTLGAGSAEAAFCDAAREVRAGTLMTTEDVLAHKGIAALVPSDAAFESDFKTWRSTRASTLRYLMRALELQERGDAEPELVVNEDVDSVNLEHVLPKAATLTDWPAFSDEDKRGYIDRIGNVCLLQKGPNGRIGNKSWAVKKPILAASTLRLTAAVGTAADWTKSEIDARQVTLAALAVQTWPRSPRA